MSKSPSLRRIQADIRELALEPSDRYHAAPLEDDMFEWHFTIRGPEKSEFEGGIYHGRILLPPEYPFKPPHIVFLTPSGRFEINTKVCLSFTAYHQELWQPAWGIRLILEAIISFLPTPADGAIGALDWSKEERKRLAAKSRQFVCDKCGPIINHIPTIQKKPTDNDNDNAKVVESKFSKEIEMLKQLQLKNETKNIMLKKKESNDSNNARKNEDNKVPSNDAVETTRDVNTSIGIHSHNNTGSASQQLVSRPITVTNVNTAVPTTTTSSESSWLSDPLIHGSIVIFSAIAFLFYRKIENLLNELDKLNE